MTPLTHSSCQVSKSWMALTRDGQLWARLDLHAFPNLPAQTLLGLAAASGSFATALDLRGHAGLTSLTLQRAVDGLCMQPHAPGGGLPFTLLTDVRLRGCRAVSTRSLHALLTRAPALVALDVRGLPAVTNTTCDVLGVYCARLEVLDISRCARVDAAGLHSLCIAAHPLRLRELRAAGLRGVGPELMRALARAAPALEVLDLSGARTLDDAGVRAFVQCGADDACAKVQLSAREAGRDPADGARHWRRVTALRHLALSGCTALTDGAGAALAHALPALELLELAGIGPALREPGLVRLVRTTPALRALDLEDASAVADDVLAALPTARLERLCVAYADATDAALVRAAPRLRVLEADNTHLSGGTLAAFVHAARARGIRGAYCAAGDNRGVGEVAVHALDTVTRPRAGFRAWDARTLAFVDGADGEGLGTDECDDGRVVVKTFYSWQTVDAIAATRRKRAKARRAESPPGGSRMRWWSPGGRRASTLASTDPREAGEGCVVM
jgi:F-box/leucine-rich repeat protein 2/20